MARTLVDYTRDDAVVITGEYIVEGEETKFKKSCDAFLRSLGINTASMNNKQIMDRTAKELARIIQKAAKRQRTAETDKDQSDAVNEDVEFMPDEPEPMP